MKQSLQVQIISNSNVSRMILRDTNVVSIVTNDDRDVVGCAIISRGLGYFGLVC